MGDWIKEKSRQALSFGSKITDSIKSGFTSHESAVDLKIVFSVAMVIIIAVVGFSYIHYITSGMMSKECNKFNLYIKNTSITSISVTDAYKHPINYYQIKSSFNSCSLGSFVDDYVSTCILEKIIGLGVRCFDFEIFNIDDKAVISTSSESENPWMKNTYNSVKFTEVLNMIVNKAMMQNDSCVNYQDPVFLSLRMNTTNIKVFNDIAENLQKHINRLVPGFSYGGNGIDFLAKVSLYSVIGKLVVMVKDDSRTLQQSNLYEYTNVIMGSEQSDCWCESYSYIEGSDDSSINTIMTNNKLKTMYIYPDTENNVPVNPKWSLCQKAGVQMAGMAYQVPDNNLKAYELFFKEKAFIIKQSQFLPTTETTLIEPPTVPNVFTWS